MVNMSYSLSSWALLLNSKRFAKDEIGLGQLVTLALYGASYSDTALDITRFTQNASH